MTSFTHRLYPLVLLVACSRSPTPTPTPTPTPAAQLRDVHTHLEIVQCLPVGYGLACSCDIMADGGKRSARLEVCIGKSEMPDGLYERVSQAPIVGHGGPPLAMWVDTKPAASTDRYCGVLIGDATEHITAFGP